MSLKTWKRIHLPVPASRIKTWLGALNHSLRKWTGAEAANIRKHQLSLGDKTVLVERIYTGGECALCLLAPENCSGCPLYESRGKVRCDISIQGQSPYSAWIFNHDPRPMIAALTKAKAWYRQQRKRKKG
jgi:hypothetical protein